MSCANFSLLTIVGIFSVFVSESQAFSVGLVDKPYLKARFYPELKRQKAGTKAAIKCKVNPEKGYDIKWTFRGGKIQAKASLDTIQHTLFVPFLTPQDAGEYACRITDRLGQLAVAKTVLDVIANPPKKVDIFDSASFNVVMTPPRLNKIAGSEASLSCKVTGAKDYKITWSFAGGKLKSKVRLSKLGDELFIPQLSIKDAGAYICRATNTFGHVKTKSSILRVFVPSKQVAETMDMMMTTTKGTEGMVEVVSKKSKGMVSGPTPTIGAVIFTCVFLQIPQQ